IPPPRPRFPPARPPPAPRPAAVRASPADGPALDGPGLRARAAAKGLLFGSAVQQNQVAANAGFAPALRREAALVPPEFDLKWAAVRPTPSNERFAEPDRLLEWCGAQG